MIPLLRVQGTVGRAQMRDCLFLSPIPIVPCALSFPSLPSLLMAQEASVEEEIADELIFGKEISKIAND